MVVLRAVRQIRPRRNCSAASRSIARSARIATASTLLSFRNLAEPGGPGFSAAQVAAVAAEYKIKDGPNDAGEMFERPGRPADRFPSPFANENAARASNGGAYAARSVGDRQGAHL